MIDIESLEFTLCLILLFLLYRHRINFKTQGIKQKVLNCMQINKVIKQ